jgi:hypothetical protein
LTGTLAASIQEEGKGSYPRQEVVMRKLLGLAVAWWLRKPENRARLKRKGKEMLTGFRRRGGSSARREQRRHP